MPAMPCRLQPSVGATFSKNEFLLEQRPSNSHIPFYFSRAISSKSRQTIRARGKLRIKERSAWNIPNPFYYGIKQTITFSNKYHQLPFLSSSTTLFTSSWYSGHVQNHCRIDVRISPSQFSPRQLALKIRVQGGPMWVLYLFNRRSSCNARAIPHLSSDGLHSTSVVPYVRRRASRMSAFCLYYSMLEGWM